MTAKHTPPGDDSFRRSLLRSGAGAVGLVALVAVAFALVGGLGPDADGPLVAEAPEDSGAAEEPDAEEAEVEEPDEPADDAEGHPEPEPEEPEEPEESDPAQEAEPDAEDGPGDEDVEEPEPDDAAEDEDDAEPQPTEEEAQEAESSPARQFAPGDVTVQVLDGYQADGGAAASGVAGTLREQGYTIMGENPARRYEVTTVLWTPGFEAQARQVAADLGAAEVRQQPGNLSERVQVHVVVGADRG